VRVRGTRSARSSAGISAHGEGVEDDARAAERRGEHDEHPRHDGIDPEPAPAPAQTPATIPWEGSRRRRRTGAGGGGVAGAWTAVMRRSDPPADPGWAAPSAARDRGVPR
jgi:hypothetical protein